VYNYAEYCVFVELISCETGIGVEEVTSTLRTLKLLSRSVDDTTHVDINVTRIKDWLRRLSVGRKLQLPLDPELIVWSAHQQPQPTQVSILCQTYCQLLKLWHFEQHEVSPSHIKDVLNIVTGAIDLHTL